MNTQRIDALPEAKTPHRAVVKKLIDNPHLQAMQITLEPGQALHPHITPVDVTFWVLAGEPTIEIGDEKQTVPTQTLVESPKDIPHCIYNEGQRPAVIAVFKTPRPQKAGKLL